MATYFFAIKLTKADKNHIAIIDKRGILLIILCFKIFKLIFVSCSKYFPSFPHFVSSFLQQSAKSYVISSVKKFLSPNFVHRVKDEVKSLLVYFGLK